MSTPKIAATTVCSKFERDTLVRALADGLMPAIGLHHIQVGRLRETRAILDDLEHVALGGSSFRVVQGDYGSGKTFFINLSRLAAHRKGFVVAQVDLDTSLRFASTERRAQELIKRIMANLSTLERPGGAALDTILGRFYQKARRDGGADPEASVEQRLHELTQGVGGYGFASAVRAVIQGGMRNDVGESERGLRWLRAEYRTLTEARETDHWTSKVGDDDLLPHIRSLTLLCRLAGYAGLVVMIDEVANLSRIPSAKSRLRNYERILGIVNEVHQGNLPGTSFMLGATYDSVEDVDVGMASYGALRQRLSHPLPRVTGFNTTMGAVIPLSALSLEEMQVMLQKVRDVWYNGQPARVGDEQIAVFMRWCADHYGPGFQMNPRRPIRSLVAALDIVDARPGASLPDVLASLRAQADVIPDAD